MNGLDLVTYSLWYVGWSILSHLFGLISKSFIYSVKTGLLFHLYMFHYFWSHLTKKSVCNQAQSVHQLKKLFLQGFVWYIAKKVIFTL